MKTSTKHSLTMARLLSLVACLIVALTTVADARVHAMYWDSSTGMVDLGSLGGDSQASGINDSGQIVGYSYLADESTVHMVMWTTTGGIVDLGSIDNSEYSQGNGINSAGDIVGTGFDANGRQVAFFWSSSTGYVRLGEPGSGWAGGNAINDSDTITGAPSNPDVTGTKTASGAPYAPGSTVTYTIVLTNGGGTAQGDNPGDEFTDVLPAQLALLTATATSGTAVATTGTNTVTWNGSIPAGGSVTITITATIQPSATGIISNQGTISFDSNGDGTNDTTRQTDDPAAPGAADSTDIDLGSAVIPIPTLSDFGLLVLALGMALLALGVLRRHS